MAQTIQASDVEAPATQLECQEETSSVKCEGVSGEFESSAASEKNASKVNRCSLRVWLPLLAIVSTIVSVTYLLWVRDPTWHIESLEFDKEELNQVLQIVGGKRNETVNTTVHGLISCYNPNFVSAYVQTVHYAVWLPDGTLVGNGSSSEGYFGGRVEDLTKTEIQMTVTTGLAKKLFGAAMANKGIVNVTSFGWTSAVALWFVPVYLRVRCDVVANVFELFSNPKEVIVSKVCAYNYNVFSPPLGVQDK